VITILLKKEASFNLLGCLRIALIAILLLLGVGITGYLLRPYLVSTAYSLPDDVMETVISNPEVIPTPIPRGDQLIEINFALPEEGRCNNYDADRLGYEDQQYYIKPPPNGYIAVCHQNDTLAPQGSLQVSAYPSGDPATYGFGVLFGWNGSGLSTSDSCIIGVRRKTTENGPITEAIFRERVNGETTSANQRLESNILDNRLHTLRVILLPDGSVQSYLDEQFIAQHRFAHCGQGPIGMVAWTDDDNKVYFDDLKLFSLSHISEVGE
jgi:hypothetical protein